MPNSYFQFKQFRIQQDKCAMKVGTDGVLLGAWTNPDNARRILDVGTGTGLIAIMLAQRSDALIDALEIDNSAYLQAVENGNACPWSHRLQFIHSSFNDYIHGSDQVYDLIVSNPPYHRETTRSPHTGRDLARQSLNLSYSSIIESAAKLLSNNGRISIILPASEEASALRLASKHSLFCTRFTHVLPAPGKEFSRSLLEFSFSFKPLTEDIILIEENGRHKYSQEYIRITRDYYLKFS
jgi:tRNA1Val (adenine37-N6)-methyltransferase